MKRMLLPAFFMVLLLMPAAGRGAESPQTETVQTGIELLQKEEYARAYALLFEQFRENPDQKAVNFYLGKAAYGKGDFEAAVMAFERVLIQEPSAAEAKVELAKSFYRLGAAESAVHYFDEVLAEDIPQELREAIAEFLNHSRKGAEP